MNTPPQTLEEAQAEIVRLQDELATAQNNIENFTRELSKKTEDLERVRQINQQYFLKLTAQHQPPAPTAEPEQPTPTCEEFAQTIKL